MFENLRHDMTMIFSPKCEMYIRLKIQIIKSSKDYKKNIEMQGFTIFHTIFT